MTREPSGLQGYTKGPSVLSCLHIFRIHDDMDIHLTKPAKYCVCIEAELMNRID